ncbi:hypothetical protein AN640_06690 [Candidatus Epulonipiscium fishelsonii]|uniref:Uncharacterized protein n=1 Tax=Candidatus Epulonipiscium fishelsonii TaxID=77094 RepID=A0ACC8XHB2_9FIRM|nr:hypothetical protein AN640_06690 [Epulopiscium sp. SCG-D08WGA-EpuloA1]OON98007.1 MAG: hypothetical protein ATN32_05005 [Epulopiscium sp. AS2M-Bin002]
MATLNDVKQQNKQAIIKLLFLEKILSKKRLALSLGLSFASLTNLCKELFDEGLIIEKEAIISSKAGRREIALEINKNLKKIIGITINKKTTTILVSDLSFNILNSVTIETQSSDQFYLDNIINAINKISQKFSLSNLNILGISICIEGITEGIYNNKIWTPPLNIVEYLTQKLNLIVVMDNDIRCNAMFEYIYNQEPNFIFIKYLETGINGAVILDGMILHNQNSTIVDIGHTIVNTAEEYCDICKRKGCLEKAISFATILSFAKEHFQYDHILVNLCENNPDNITITKIVEAVELGSIIFNKLFKKIASYFAISLINTITIINIKKVILLGTLFNSNRFCTYLKSNLLEYELYDIWQNIEIRTQDNNVLAPIALGINKFVFEHYNIKNLLLND